MLQQVDVHLRAGHLELTDLAINATAVNQLLGTQGAQANKQVREKAGTRIDEYGVCRHTAAGDTGGTQEAG